METPCKPFVFASTRFVESIGGLLLRTMMNFTMRFEYRQSFSKHIVSRRKEKIVYFLLQLIRWRKKIYESTWEEERKIVCPRFSMLDYFDHLSLHLGPNAWFTALHGERAWNSWWLHQKPCALQSCSIRVTAHHRRRGLRVEAGVARLRGG